MSFQRPTLAELRETAEADFASRFSLSALLPRSALLVISQALAGMIHGLHGHLAYIAKQILPDTADAEGLARYASLYGINRKAATPASGFATITGPEGTILADGVLLRRADGVEYAIDGTQTIPIGGGGTLDAAVSGISGGTLENAPASTTLTFTTPIAGVQVSATVTAAGFGNGTDLETDPELLSRLLVRLREPPQGGAAADYLAWALEVAGVTRAWVLPNHLGAGTVGVSFVVDDDPSSPIPDAAKVLEVQTYIDDDSRRPVTADVTVFAPVEVSVGFTLSITPDDPAVRAAVEANLADLIQREAGPGDTLLLTHIAEVISTTPGELDHSITFPTVDQTFTTAQIGTFGSVTWL